MTSISIHSLNIGLPKKVVFESGGSIISGIKKKPSTERVKLSLTGLEGDESFEDCHGGLNMALHVFAFENYAFYNEKAGRTLIIPTFGENLTFRGYTEAEARVGDVLAIGECRVQVSQPTERCKNIGLTFGLPKMLKWINEFLRTGFYFRVLEEGFVSSESNVELLERGLENASIAHLNTIFYRHIKNREEVEKVAATPELSEEWRNRLLTLHQRALNG